MRNTFYASIADNYDFIFPFNPAQVEFIKSQVLNTAKKSILEVGCGTGNLTFGLASQFNQVTGVDLDKAMLALAQEKNSKGNVSFIELNMLHLTKQFEKNSLDAVACFGNTMVHLNNNEEIEQFVIAARTVLKEGSPLMIQIINYDRILDENIQSLDTIDNDHIRFERKYKYHSEQHKIAFETTLQLKKTGDVIENSQNLHPIRKRELEIILMRYFKDIQFFGNFKEGDLDSNSVALIVSAK
jgi:2-polyprenyl-3-methyl-5-hydroxy-6-metoxy-1,4-benzoquinol methylase